MPRWLTTQLRLNPNLGEATIEHRTTNCWAWSVMLSTGTGWTWRHGTSKTEKAARAAAWRLIQSEGT
jgi:hypothetical protein